MPAQRTAEPVVSEASERRARLDAILSGFGFDPALVDQKLRDINSTPMGPGFYTGGLSTISADSTADEKAFAIAAWFYYSRYAPSTTNGLDGLCTDDRTATGAISELFRGSYYMGGTLKINDKAEAFFQVESEKYGLTTLKEAALFQLWAGQQGASQDAIDSIGAQLFGAEWEYGRIAGSRFSQQRDGTYYLKTDDAIEIRQTYVSIPQSAPVETEATTFGGVTPVRSVTQELTPEEQFARFYSMDGARLFSNNVNSFFGDDARKYKREHRRDGTSLTAENLQEATAFYVWATQPGEDGNPRISADDMESLGRSRYGGVWDFGMLVGSNLSYNERTGKWVFASSDNVVAVRDGFGTLAVPRAEEAATAVASAAPVAGETATGLAQLAASVGVSEEYLRRAATLMKQGTNISVAYDAATGAGEIREASRGRTTMVFFGVRGTEGEYDNNALLQAVKDASRMV